MENHGMLGVSSKDGGSGEVAVFTVDYIHPSVCQMMEIWLLPLHRRKAQGKNQDCHHAGSPCQWILP